MRFRLSSQNTITRMPSPRLAARRSSPCTLASPHIAGTTREARLNIATLAARQLLDVLDGKPPERLLNPRAWPAFAKRFERAFGFAPSAGPG